MIVYSSKHVFRNKPPSQRLFNGILEVGVASRLLFNKGLDGERDILRVEVGRVPGLDVLQTLSHRVIARIVQVVPGILIYKIRRRVYWAAFVLLCAKDGDRRLGGNQVRSLEGSLNRLLLGLVLLAHQAALEGFIG